ncbi:MAG: PilX N-terminal domain-containing pilus assembly protein [Acidiferrobacterales bacterium]
MMSSIRTSHHPPHRQQGIALIMALVFLMLLTIIGVTAMTTTSLQEKMAGNVQNKHGAFQAAESALRVGEAYLQTTTTLPTFTLAGTTPGHFLPAAATSLPVWDTVVWDTCDGTTANTAVCLPSSPKTIAGVASQPAYIIEKVVDVSGKGGGTSVVAGFKPPAGASGTATIYRVTARGTGTTDDAVAVVQSVFRK